ncbi:MAG: oligosaccharide flippase family protein [Kiritimatiellae bacterium]|nr:oligosaccharide flippase family protein [Kiritimatiellia bacterium]
MSMKSERDAHDRHIIKSSVGVMIMQWVGLMMRFAATLIVVRLVTPKDVGYVAWIGIWPVYSAWMTLGVVSGAGRLIPIMRGEGRDLDIKPMKEISFFVVLVAGASCIILGILARYLLAPWHTSYDRWAYVGAGILAASTLLDRYVLMLIGTAKRFKLMAAKIFVDGILWWIFLPLVLFGVLGLSVRLLLVSFITPLIFFIIIKGWCRPRYNRANLIKLAKTGWIIMAAAFFVSLLYAMDRTLIVIFMDDTSLGHYMLAFIVVSLVRPVTAALGRVLYPNLGELYGKTRDVVQVANKTLRPVPIMILLVLPIAIVGWFVAQPLTAWLLPEYLPGVASAKIVLCAVVFAPLLGTNVFYNVVQRQKLMMTMITFGLVVQVAVSILLYHYTKSLESFAWGFVAGMAISSTLLVLGIIRIVSRAKHTT